MGHPEFCKCFTAAGEVRDGRVYQVEMTPDFHPFRIDVDYFHQREVPLEALFHQLELTRSKSWGMQLRRGLVELCQADFELVVAAMR